MEPSTFDEHLTETLIDEFLVATRVSNGATRLLDTQLLSPTLERLALSLPPELKWTAWNNEGRTRFVVLRPRIQVVGGEIQARVHAWFFDHEKIAASGTWRRVAAGLWQIVSLLESPQQPKSSAPQASVPPEREKPVHEADLRLHALLAARQYADTERLPTEEVPRGRGYFPRRRVGERSC